MTGRTQARTILTTVTILSVLAVMGCGTNSPVSPSQDIATSPGIDDPQFAQLLSASAGTDRPFVTSTTAQVVSAADGGTVTNGYYTVHFPPGALTEDTEITMEMPYFPSAVVRLGPHGIQFEKDVTLSLETDMVADDAEAFSVLWYNEDAGCWESIGGYMEDGCVKAELQHFSDYGDYPHSP